MNAQDTIQAIGDYIISKLFDEFYNQNLGCYVPQFQEVIYLVKEIKACLLNSKNLNKSITSDSVLDYIKTSSRINDNRELTLEIAGKNDFLYLFLREKTTAEKLESFYENWYFYQTYKNNEHYEGTFTIRYK